MEERPAGTPSSAADSPASAETGSSTRRRVGTKRKSNALSSSSTPTTSKRLTREKAAISHAPIHNGPLTRAARQSPGNLATVSVKREEKAAASVAAEVAAAAAEAEKRSRLEELEGRVESEYEIIRSRDLYAHVVPNHCGWFSWTKVHPLEESVLPSFFNGKSQARTPDIYMEIRNWIVKKFHANPNTLIELKDLSKLEIGDSDARQEVLEFLDYWGLINFHPFPGTDSVDNDDSDEAEKEKLLKKLFQFEESQQCPTVLPKLDPTTPAVPSGLFPDSAIAEELARMEGPSVEYHCNSCSADCSRKRYHCQKQADYDLCADCFNNGKFGSNMSSSDFILMEPAEAAGASGGKWTDQETLLLLEALELYKENWNEIAEHVATKTKAQCILHFVQMPIEDVFFYGGHDTDSHIKETAEPASMANETSTPKDGPEAGEGNTDSKDNQPLTSASEVTKSEEGTESNVQEAAKPTDASEENMGQENLKSETTNEVNAGQEESENIALKALTEAFESVGYILTPENKLSFADVGNPVMALASYLGKLVGSEVAIASARCSLKSLSSTSPGEQLAARHCFILEDPPDDRKERSHVDCTAAEVADEDVKKDNNSISALDDGNLSSDGDKKVNNSVCEENKSPNNISTEKINVESESGTSGTHEESGKLKKSIEAELPKDCVPSTASASNELQSKPDYPENSVKEQHEGSSGEPSQLIELNKDLLMVPDLKPSEKNEPSQSATPMSVDEPPQAGDVSKDVEKDPDSSPSGKNAPEQPMKSNSFMDVPDEVKDVDMLSLESSERSKSGQPDTNSHVENGPSTVKDQNNSSEEKPEQKDLSGDHDMDKLKRAAVSAISAAAVKAKLLANQEEDQIRQLAASLIEKQLHKLEMKLSFFNEMDAVVMRVKEQLDRAKQKLFHDRAQIIAARLGIPPSAARGMPPSLPNRIAMNFANSNPRHPMVMNSLRPPISRPIGTMPPASGPFVSTAAGSSIRPSGQDNVS